MPPGWFADAFSTSELPGTSGVNTFAATGTQIPYRGSTLTVACRSAAVIAFCVALAPTCWTAWDTAALTWA